VGDLNQAFHKILLFVILPDMLAIVINTLVVESPETRRGGGEGRADVLSILQTDRSEILGPNQRLTLSQQKIEAR